MYVRPPAAPPQPRPGVRSAAPVPLRFLRDLERLLAASGIAVRGGPPPAWCGAGPRGRAEAGEDGRPPWLGRVVAFIEERVGEPLSLDALAREAGLSKYHFARVFREEVGVPPWAFVREARLRRAKALLDEGLPPAAVAAEAGFYDQAHFTKALKRAEGVTPARYRRRRGRRKDVQDR